MPTLNARQEQALAALRAAGGEATVWQMIDAGHLSVDPKKTDFFGRQTDRSGWGRTFLALERRGLVTGRGTTINSIGTAMWSLVPSGEPREAGA